MIILQGRNLRHVQRHWEHAVHFLLFSGYQSVVGCLLLRLNTTTKKQLGEERLCSPCSSTLLFSTEGSQDSNSQLGRTLQAGAAAHTGPGVPLTALLPWLAVAFLWNQDHQPTDGVTHRELGFCHWSVTDKRPDSWLSWGHFLNWGSFSLWWC